MERSWEGKTLGQFKIGSLLGTGGMGSVYRAVDSRKAAQVALKFLTLADRASQNAFRAEVSLLSHLSHPHLVKIFDFFEGKAKKNGGPATPFFSMEYVDGPRLDQLPRPIPYDTALSILCQFCQGLHYLHSRQILHRDLKPGNAFWTPSEGLKIVDFGLSVTGLAKNEPVIGTWAYLPPEAFARAYDRVSDLFSLGVLFYEILSGRLPFTRPLLHLRDIPRPPSLHTLRPDLPEFFCDLIDRLIELHPSRRPASALAVIRYLNHHLEKPIPILGLEENRPFLEKIPWVERGEFWEILAALQSPNLDSPPRFLTLTGPTGVGRSRLLEEVKWSHQLQGGDFLGFTDQEAEDWAEVAWRYFGETPHPNSQFLGQDFLKKFSGRPMALAFQDLQDWPEHSLGSLEKFLRFASTQNLPWSILLEWNQDPRWPWENQLLEFIKTLPNPLHFELGDLSPEKGREMVSGATLETPIAPALQEEILQTSGGRPLLIVEALRHHLTPLRGAGEGKGAALPRGMAQAVAFRTQNLSSGAQGMLAVIVAHPRQVDWETASIIVEKSLTDLEEVRLELNGFIRETGAMEMALAHPSLREAYQKGLPEALLEKTHRRWLEFLSGPKGELLGPKDRTWLLAHHAWGARETTEIENWGPKAAQLLLDQGELQGALEWYGRLLSGASAKDRRAYWEAHRAPLLYRLARYPEAMEAYDSWFDQTTDDGTDVQRVKYQLYTGQTKLTAGDEKEAEKDLEACLQSGDSRAHPKHRLYHARAHILLSSLREKSGDLPSAQGHLEAALTLAAEDPLVLAEAHQKLGALEQNRLDLASSLQHYRQSLEIYRQAKNPQSEAIAQNSIGMVLREQGAIREAEDALKAAYTLATAGGDLRQQGSYLENLALIQMDQAQYGAAFSAMEAAREILDPFGDPLDRTLMRLHRAQLYLWVGNWEAADRILVDLGNDGVLETMPALPGPYLQVMGERFYLAGRWQEAEGFFQDALKYSEQANKKSEGLGARLGLVRCWIRRGGLPDADSMATLLQDLTGLGGLFGLLWRGVIDQLASGAFDPAALVDLVKIIESCELPELRLELYSLLSTYYGHREKTDLAEGLEKLSHMEWNNLYHLIPEELKMDFEKNRPMQKASQALQDLIEKKTVAPPSAIEAPKVAEGPPPTVGISEMRFRQFSEIIRQILQKSKLGDILDTVMDAALELSRAERGFCLLKSEGKGTGPIPDFEIQAARQFNPQALQLKEHQFSMTAVEEAIRQGTFILTDNASLDPRFREKESVAQFNLKSILVIPLEVQGKTLGVFYLDHRFQPDCFNEEDVSLVTRFSLLAALAIERARLIEELQRAKQQLEGQVHDQAQKIEMLTGELAQVREDLKYGYEEIVGQSPSMMRIFQQLDHVTETAIPVWILGESGTGKELIARSLHFNSPRKSGPFVTENVSAIPETLLESELFGHKKGAFTHADRDRIGLFEQAHQGTLFLDEIADMSLAMQAKLLRVLQEGEVRPVGANKKVKIDVRLVTASNRDLKDMVKDGKFRQDLFYRINGMTIKLPPLRERKEDLPILVNHLVQKIAREFKLQPSEVTDEAMHLFLRYPWPGNVRELEGVLRNALLFAKGRPLTSQLLAANESLFKEPDAPSALGLSTPEAPSEEQRAERQIILEALRRHQLDKKSAADELGISLRNLYVRMGRHGIPKKKTVLAKYLGVRS